MEYRERKRALQRTYIKTIDEKKHYQKYRQYYVDKNKRFHEQNPSYQRDKYHENPEKFLAYGHLRRSRMRNLPSDFSGDDWHDVLDLFDNKCAYCGEEKKLEQDHFIPITLDGGYEVGNIVPACKLCNSSKNKNHPLEWAGPRLWLDTLEIAHCV